MIEPSTFHQVLVPAAISVVLGLALPAVVIPWLRRMGVVDVPGARSSHSVPTVRGTGAATALAAVVAAGASLLLGVVEVDRSVMLTVLAGAAAAGLLGWREDCTGLSVRWRAAAQLVVGALVTVVLTLLLGTSVWWIPLGVLAIAGYINVVNFMDGLNGISGLHGLAVGAAYAYAGWATGHGWLVVCGTAVAGAYLAFLPWNLAGRRVFLGDTGSYFLGGAIACCAVAGFLSGIYLEYLLPPMIIYLADTGSTLFARIYRGEAWYQPHRQHVYQRLTDQGLSHLGSAAVVTAATVAVTVLSVLSLGLPGAGQAGMGLLVCLVVAGYLALPALLARWRAR